MPQRQGPATMTSRPPPPKCTFCGQLGHTQNRCWIKNPSLRPLNTVANQRGGRGGRSRGRGRNTRQVRRVGAVVVADPATEGGDEQLVAPEVGAVFEPPGLEN